MHSSSLETMPLQAAAMAIGVASFLFTGHAVGQQASPSRATQSPQRLPLQGAAGSEPSVPRLACTSVTAGEPVHLALGKSRVIQLSSPAIRLIGGGGRGSFVGQASATGQAQPGAASTPAATQTSNGVAETEITLLSPTELLVLGRRPGSANVIVQDREGRCVVRDITITVDPLSLEGKLREVLPQEPGVRVAAAGDSIVLTGSVTDAATLDQVMSLASAYAADKRLVNLLRVTAPQQVMLEVKIAEVSKGLLNRIGLDYTRAITSGDRTSLISGIIGGAPGVYGRFSPSASSPFGAEFAASIASPNAAATVGTVAPLATRGASLLGLDLEDRDGIVRLLAEPNIMAISGQAASFLSGGKIFIPVAQSNQGGGTVITLEEKEFGVGLKFTPTVLDGRINLKVASEVSELSQSGSPFTTVGGVTSVIPSFTTRRVDTTVQLGDGQSFAVAGLIRHNYAGAITKFPGLGDAPVLGALFRSTEFQNDQTELLFVITPRLVRPTVGPISLPTDNLVVPSRSDLILRGAGEGSPPATGPFVPGSAPAAPTVPAVPEPSLAPPAAPPRPTSSAPSGDNAVVASAVPPASSPKDEPLPSWTSLDAGGQPAIN